MSYLLGIDIGTSGTKTLICDYAGTVGATAMAEHDVSSPQPGWSEQDPAQWWQATCKATRAVLRKAKVKADQVTGIGLSGQMHGSVFLANDERPLHVVCTTVRRPLIIITVYEPKPPKWTTPETRER